MDPKKPVLSVTFPEPISNENAKRFREYLKPIAESMGATPCVIGEGGTLQYIDPNILELINAQTQAIQALTEAVLTMIESLEEEEQTPPENYLDGSPAEDVL